LRGHPQGLLQNCYRKSAFGQVESGDSIVSKLKDPALMEMAGMNLARTGMTEPAVPVFGKRPVCRWQKSG